MVARSSPSATLKRKVRDLLLLTRMEYAAPMALTPIIGALAVTPQLSVSTHLRLFLIGLVTWVYDVVQNDVMDVEVDRLSIWEKPLLTGSISRQTALWLALSQIPLAQLLAGMLLRPNPRAHLLLLLSFGFATTYNVWGKRFPLSPILGDLCASISVGLLALFGVFAVSDTITPLALVLAVHCTLQHVLLNGIDGGLKDLDHDHLAGGQSTAYWLGVRLHGADSLKVPILARFYALALEATLLVLISIPLATNWLRYSRAELVTASGLLACLAALAFVGLARELWEKSFEKAKKLVFLHCIPTFCAMPALLVFQIGAGRAIGLGLSLFAWYMPWSLLQARLRE